MKILLYHSSSFLNPHFGLLLDEAEKYLRNGDEVYFATCSGAASMCISNILADKSICKVCKMEINRFLNQLSKGVHKIDMGKYVDTKRSAVKFRYNSIDELKRLKYKDAQIGYAVMSYYITLTRNLEPAMNEAFTRYIDKALQSAVLLTDAFIQILDEVKPDRVLLFNGRFFENRPILECSLAKGCETYCCEVVGGFGEEFKKTTFLNVMPHNVEYNINLVKKRWEDTSVPMAEKMRIGKSFYENRRGGKPAGDKIYIKNQKAGQLPTDWDGNKRNFAIFNSSEDEYASIGGEFDRLKFFSNQMEGIKKVLTLCQDDENIHVFLRIHPNLTGIKYRYHQDLYKLPEEFPNVTVIPADAKISTYALMDSVEKVIVFGSTMGLEATYWEKPVLLLGASYYTPLDMCYKPGSMEELKHLLLGELQPKGKQMAIEFGYSFMYRSPEDGYEYFDFNRTGWNLRGKTLELSHYQTLFGSKKLYALYAIGLKKCFDLFGKHRHFVSIPDQEAEEIK